MLFNYKQKHDLHLQPHDIETNRCLPSIAYLLLTDIYILILCIVTAHFTPEYIWFKA